MIHWMDRYGFGERHAHEMRAGRTSVARETSVGWRTVNARMLSLGAFHNGASFVAICVQAVLVSAFVATSGGLKKCFWGEVNYGYHCTVATVICLPPGQQKL